MSGKEKVVISNKRDEQWNKRISECFEELYKSTQGRLLTTMEVALPNGSQLEALKSRIKDVQGTEWDEIIQAERDVRYCYFEINDSIPNVAESYKERVEEFGIQLAHRIDNHLNCFERVIKNLASLAVEDAKKREALKQEIGRILSETNHIISRWIYRGIEGVFEIK